MTDDLSGLAGRAAGRFLNQIDVGDFDAAADAFGPSARLIVDGEPWPPARGLLQLFQSDQGCQRHLYANLLVESQDVGYKARAVVTTYRFGATPYVFAMGDLVQRWDVVSGELVISEMSYKRFHPDGA
jgi:hypothetical protein